MHALIIKWHEFTRDLILRHVTLIFGARISSCPNFARTEKCGHDLDKAGQTTGVSYSTHRLGLSRDCVLMSLDHIQTKYRSGILMLITDDTELKI